MTELGITTKLLAVLVRNIHVHSIDSAPRQQDLPSPNHLAHFLCEPSVLDKTFN